MDAATSAYAALLERLQALDPAHMTPRIKEARLLNWEHQCGSERGRKTLTDKVKREIATREAKKEREEG